MKQVWIAEFNRLLSFALITVLIGFMTQWWAVAVSIGAITFIAWHYIQLRQLAHWIQNGFKDQDSPDGNGVWEYMVELIYRRQRIEKKQKRKFQQTLARFNEIIAALPYAAIVLKDDLEITWSNQVARDILGVRSEDAGQRITNLIRNSDFSEFIRNFNETNHRFELPSPCDKYKTVMLRITKFAKSQYLLIGRDVTDRVELQRTRKQFVANASHELRTPLSVVSGYLEILEQEPDIPPMASEAINNAIEHANRMRSIIDGMLTLAVLENRHLKESEGELVDVDERIHQQVRSMAESGLLDEHEIRVDSDPDLMLFAMDIEIDSVLSNLVKNAIKYTEAGSVIWVRWVLDKQKQACLSVEDNGSGIAQEHITHISERFYRIDEGRDRKNGGTGLGLSIVKHIMERHNGQLFIDSELGKGSVFTACFPNNRIRIAQQEEI